MLPSRGAVLAATAFRDEPQGALHPALQALGVCLKPQITKIPLKGGGVIAKVPVEGVLAYAPHPIESIEYGMEDLRNISEMLGNAQTDPDVKGVLLSVNSPGGFVTGAFDVADQIGTLGQNKPVVAHVGGTSASLAYLLTSQARQIVAGRGSNVGSLGAYITVVDASRHLGQRGIEFKTYANKEGDLKGMAEHTPLTTQQQNFLQSRAQQTFDQMRNMVETARGVLKPEAMRGQSFYGEEAKSYNLIDNIGSESFAISLLSKMV